MALVKYGNKFVTIGGKIALYREPEPPEIINLRLPTEAEWEAERLSWATNNAAGAHGSPLALTMAGYRGSSNGLLDDVGSYGGYWSSTVDGTYSRSLYFFSSAAGMGSSDRAYGHSVRLIVDEEFTQAEFENDYETKIIQIDGVDYGFCFSPETGIVDPLKGRIWLDRNLGASRVATSSTDTEAYGDLYQWGRAADGHQLRTSGTTSTLSNSDTPGHGNFITVGSDPYDWRDPQNDNLWQGVNGINNPGHVG